MQKLVGSLMRSRQFDAVHADQLWMAQYGLGAQSSLNGQASQPRMVLDQHNAVYLIPQRLADNESSQLKRWVLQREARVMKNYEIATCARFDTIVWVTDEDRRVIESAERQLINSITIPICVDPGEKSEIRRRSTARRVTFLGGLHWPPNAAGIVWFANEVWPQVLDQVPDARLTVIGKEPPRELVDQQSEIQNLDVTGYIDDPEPLLAETGVFIVPLHAGGGMRVKVIDAWSWGLPIVSTTVGAEGIQYKDSEDILIADSEDAFAQAVARILQEPELGNRLSRAGRSRVETTYDWHKTYRAWDEVYPIAITVPID
jgi:glycosyltransferase involved in cell wall biosynthesis